MACAHQPCKCKEIPVVSGGKAYCSEACASAAKAASNSCSCGHEDCPSAERRSPNPPGERAPREEVPAREPRRPITERRPR